MAPSSPAAGLVGQTRLGMEKSVLSSGSATSLHVCWTKIKD